MFSRAKIRLTIPEAYAQHKSIIEWAAQFSADKVPGQAVGVDPVTERFMSWVMASWKRVVFFYTFLLGQLPPRLQLELLPSLRRGAHFSLSATAPLSSIDDYLAAGRAMQRFWLSAANRLVHPARNGLDDFYPLPSPRNCLFHTTSRFGNG